MGKVATTAPAAPKNVPVGTMSVRDEDGGEDGYYVQDETKESCLQDMDDFERRLNGERIAPRANHAKGGNPPAKAIKMVAPPFMPAAAHQKVRPTSMTEDEEDRADDIKAVGELDRFEMRLPSNK